MQKEDRDSLRRNFVRLVREIPVDPVVDRLFQDKILTDEQREEILSKNNSYSKARDLIATLQRRGPHAFDRFCSALVAEGKGNLANLLRNSNEGTSVGVQSKERCMIGIGDDVFLVVNEWEGEVLIHIRRYEKTLQKSMYPPRKELH